MKKIDQDTSNENLELDGLEWDERKLGAQAEFATSVPVPSVFHEILDQSSNLQMISIRLPKDLINDLKVISSTQKMGYQSLVRELLKRFVDSEKKIMYQTLRRENEELERKLQEAEALLKEHKAKKRA